jgi:hypothetical protein
MRIYISSSREDLSVARRLAGQLPSHPILADASEVIVYTPLDNMALAGTDDASSGEWQESAARAEQQMADSGFIVLLLSPAALLSPWVARDLDQVYRVRDARVMKFIVKFVLQPISPDPAFDATLDGLQTVDAASLSLDELVGEVAYYATWRVRQTGGSIRFGPTKSRPAPPETDDRDAPFAPGAAAGESGAWEIEEERGEDQYAYPAAPPPPSAPPYIPQPPDVGGVPPSAPPPPAYAPPPPPGEAPSAPPYAQPAPAPQAPPPGYADEPPVSRGRAPDVTTPSTQASGTLQFSAYHPNTVAVETWQTMLVYTFLSEALAQIQADAATFTELGSAPTVAKGQASRQVEQGVELTAEPHVEGVTFSPARESFVWRGDWHRSLFRFSGSSELAGRPQQGWIDIYAAPMVPVARIDLSIPFHDGHSQLLAARQPRGMVVTSNLYDAVFISYSHRDTEAFRQACDEYKRFGITVYTDQNLPAGAQYESDLARMIAESNIFHLLWSSHSSGSVECRKEWVAALQREASERFIKPWFWKQPLVKVPDEFAQHRISFRYEPLRRSLWRPSTWFA